MPEPTTHKIEELKFKLKNDPKSRLFYPLAEELRKIGRFVDAENYLRSGLAHHGSYLSAWVSLGRVLREMSKNPEAVDALKQALTVDPGNMVAAKLLAETYYEMGDKVEAIKKYKLVHALLPADDEISAKIEQLHRELNPPTVALVEPPPSIVRQPPPVRAVPPPPPIFDERPAIEDAQEAEVTEEDTFAPSDDFSAADETHQSGEVHEDLFDRAEVSPPSAISIEPTMGSGASLQNAVDVDHRHAMSQFEFSAPEDEFGGQEPESFETPTSGPAIDGIRASNEHSTPDQELRSAEAGSAAYSFGEPAEEPEKVPETLDSDPGTEDEEVTATSTMADLYAQQGHFDSARAIYERLLQKDPANEEMKKRLDDLPSSRATAPMQNVAVERLQGWLRKIKGDAGRV